MNRKKAGDTEAIAEARAHLSMLLASGFMAGGANMGVVATLVKMGWPDGFPILSEASATGAVGEWIAIAALAALCTCVVVGSRRNEA